jgi:PASTA domain
MYPGWTYPPLNDMSTRTRATRLVLLALGLLWIAAGPVPAATIPSPVASLSPASLSPSPSSSGPVLTVADGDGLTPGTLANVSGSDFFPAKPGDPCSLYFDRVVDDPTPCTVGENGSIEGIRPVPAGAALGAHEIEACVLACTATPTTHIVVRRLIAFAPVTVVAPVVLVTVPRIVNRSARKAAAILGHAGLRMSPTRPKDDIVATQDPRAGSQVKPGSTVRVTLRPPVVQSKSASASTSATASATVSATASPSDSPSTVISIGTSSGTGVRLSGGGALLAGGAALAGMSGLRLRSSRRRLQRDRSRRWVHDHLRASASDDIGQDVRLDVLDRAPSPRLRLEAVPDPMDLR